MATKRGIAGKGLRLSRFITNKQATQFSAAIRFSKRLGCPLNQFVTLNLAHTACPRGLASLAVQDLIKNRFGRWLRYQEVKARKAGQPSYGAPTYAWVIEAKGGLTHLHWCVHVDPRLQASFARVLPKWLARSAGAIEKPIGAINITSVYGIGGLLKYCLKGLNHYHAGKRFVVVEDQGEVWGKRVGLSKSLGQAARRQHRGS